MEDGERPTGGRGDEDRRHVAVDGGSLWAQCVDPAFGRTLVGPEPPTRRGLPSTCGLTLYWAEALDNTVIWTAETLDRRAVMEALYKQEASSLVRLARP